VGGKDMKLKDEWKSEVNEATAGMNIPLL